MLLKLRWLRKHTNFCEAIKFTASSFASGDSGAAFFNRAVNPMLPPTMQLAKKLLEDLLEL
jgi:hypothetical protein